MTNSKYSAIAGYGTSALISLLLLLSFSSLAQTGTIRLGIKAGVNRMGVQFNPGLVGGTEFVPGYEAGLVFQHLAEPHFGIQLDLAVKQLNWQHRQDSVRYFTLQQYDVEFTAATYIYFGKPQNSVFINLGPTIGNTVKVKDQAFGSESSNVHLLGNQARTYLFYGITVGAGFTKKIGPTTWQLEGRFSQRLTNLFKTGPGSDLTFNRILPSTLGVSLAYLIYSRNK